MAVNLAQARQFIADADIPEPFLEPQGDELSFFEHGKDQAAVVGQDVFAFMAGTDAALRDVLSDSALLAQMIADTQVQDPNDVVGWYDAYFRVLKQVGWLVHETGWSEISEAGDGFEVHEKIVDIAGVLLGGAPTALAVITRTLGALKAAQDDSPWITLFHKRAIKGQSARFQVGLVQPDDGAGALVTLMAFALSAKSVVTQVLLFKVKKNRATLRTNNAKVGLDLAALRDLAPDIRAKLRGWQRTYIKGLPDLELPPAEE